MSLQASEAHLLVLLNGNIYRVTYIDHLASGLQDMLACWIFPNHLQLIRKKPIFANGYQGTREYSLKLSNPPNCGLSCVVAIQAWCVVTSSIVPRIWWKLALN